MIAKTTNGCLSLAPENSLEREWLNEVPGIWVDDALVVEPASFRELVFEALTAGLTVRPLDKSEAA